jgi:hypothetical protein
MAAYLVKVSESNNKMKFTIICNLITEVTITVGILLGRHCIT